MTKPAKKISGRGLVAHLHQVTVAHRAMHAAAHERVAETYVSAGSSSPEQTLQDESEGTLDG